MADGQDKVELCEELVSIVSDEIQRVQLIYCSKKSRTMKNWEHSFGIEEEVCADLVAISVVQGLESHRHVILPCPLVACLVDSSCTQSFSTDTYDARRSMLHLPSKFQEI